MIAQFEPEESCATAIQVHPMDQVDVACDSLGLRVRRGCFRTNAETGQPPKPLYSVSRWLWVRYTDQEQAEELPPCTEGGSTRAPLS